MGRVLVVTAALTVALLACKSEHKPADPAGTARDSTGALVAAPTPIPRAAGAADPNAITRPFLWKAEKGGTTSWLFGTLHLGVNADTQLPSWVLDKIGTVATFVMEAD